MLQLYVNRKVYIIIVNILPSENIFLMKYKNL